MKDVFLISGYGIPKNILKDENYNFYLKLVFNKIYELTTSSKNKWPIVITCGGKTDMFKPYKRTEADEMLRLLKSFIKERKFLKPITKNWLFIAENKSLSTIENLLNSNGLIKNRKIKKANVFIFCEQTREKRIKILAKKTLYKNYKIKILPIDFDVSKNRYLSPDFLNKKEKVELKHSLWALKSPTNLKKHREVFEEKIEFLRKAGNKTHTNAVREWWEKKLNELCD